MKRRHFFSLASFFSFVRISSSQSNPDSGNGVAVDKYDLVHLKVQDFASLANAQPVWSTPCRKTNSSPAVAGDKVILLERVDREQERIRCFRLGTGQSVWEHRYAAPLPGFFDGEFGWGPHSTPAIQEGMAITIGVTGIVSAIDIETGRKLWRRDLWSEFPATPLERGFASSPHLDSNRLIVPVGGNGSGFVALSLKEGRTLWASTGFESAYTSPVAGTLDGQRQLVVLMQDVLAGIDRTTGRLLWRTPFQTPNSVHVASPLMIDQHHVLAGSSGGTRLFRVDKQSHGWKVEQLWKSSRCAPQIGNYIRVQEQVIAPASGGSTELTTCLNLRDGSVAWKERFGGRGSLFRLQDGFATLNDSGDLEVRTSTPSGTRNVFRFSNFAVSPQWSVPAFTRDVMVLQSGETLQVWRLGNLTNRNRDSAELRIPSDADQHSGMKPIKIPGRWRSPSERRDAGSSHDDPIGWIEKRRP